MKIYNRLLKEISSLKVIDAHEHLYPEKDRLAMDVDVLTLFGHYNRCDLGSAGMSAKDILNIQDKSIPLEKRWQLFKPFWKNIEFTSYAKALKIVLRDIFGIEELNDNTFQEASICLKKMNISGLYKKILREKCNIETVLNQGVFPDKDDELLKIVYRYDQTGLFNISKLSDIEKLESEKSISLKNGDDLTEYLRKDLTQAVRENGAVGFKIVGLELEPVTSSQVNIAIKNIRNKGVAEKEDILIMQRLVIHTVIEESVKLNVPVAVHVGLTWANWIDFYPLRPSNILPWLDKYRDAKFDIYHMGIPWHDEVMIIAKIYPNVWLNLCWCHIVSQKISTEILIKLLELVPVNKIIGFGGDYNYPVENVYGHYIMALHDIAEALTDKIENDSFDFDKAVEIANMWLYENPKKLYNL